MFKTVVCATVDFLFKVIFVTGILLIGAVVIPVIALGKLSD